jgi:hypothetical protein
MRGWSLICVEGTIFLLLLTEKVERPFQLAWRVLGTDTSHCQAGRVKLWPVFTLLKLHLVLVPTCFLFARPQALCPYSFQSKLKKSQPSRQLSKIACTGPIARKRKPKDAGERSISSLTAINYGVQLRVVHHLTNILTWHTFSIQRQILFDLVSGLVSDRATASPPSKRQASLKDTG